MKSKSIAKVLNWTFFETVLSEEVYLSAFDSRQKIDHNMRKATGCQTLTSNVMSPYFVNDMFNTTKRQKCFFI